MLLGYRSSATGGGHWPLRWDQLGIPQHSLQEGQLDLRAMLRRWASPGVQTPGRWAICCMASRSSGTGPVGMAKLSSAGRAMPCTRLYPVGRASRATRRILPALSAGNNRPRRSRGARIGVAGVGVRSGRGYRRAGGRTGRRQRVYAWRRRRDPIKHPATAAGVCSLLVAAVPWLHDL